MNPEDEAFNDIERQAKQRKEAVRAAVQTLSEYERGFIDGMQKQMQSSVDKAVNAMSQRTWVGLTISQRDECWRFSPTAEDAMEAVEAKLKEKNT